MRNFTLGDRVSSDTYDRTRTATSVLGKFEGHMVAIEETLVVC